jgi:hypothetical protein
MKCYICLTKTGRFLLTYDANKGTEDCNRIWAFDVVDAKDASLKFNRFVWVYQHHKSEIEVVKALNGKEDSSLLPDHSWIEKAIKENNTFGAVLAMRALKSISIPEAQDEVHEIRKKLSEQL